MTLGYREVCFQLCSVISMVGVCTAFSAVHDSVVTADVLCLLLCYVLHNGACQCFTVSPTS